MGEQRKPVPRNLFKDAGGKFTKVLKDLSQAGLDKFVGTETPLEAIENPLPKIPDLNSIGRSEEADKTTEGDKQPKSEPVEVGLEKDIGVDVVFEKMKEKTKESKEKAEGVDWDGKEPLILKSGEEAWVYKEGEGGPGKGETGIQLKHHSAEKAALSIVVTKNGDVLVGQFGEKELKVDDKAIEKSLAFGITGKTKIQMEDAKPLIIEEIKDENGKFTHAEIKFMVAPDEVVVPKDKVLIMGRNLHSSTDKDRPNVQVLQVYDEEVIDVPELMGRIRYAPGGKEWHQQLQIKDSQGDLKTADRPLSSGDLIDLGKGIKYEANIGEDNELTLIRVEGEEETTTWKQSLKKTWDRIDWENEWKLLVDAVRPKNAKELVALAAQIYSVVNPVVGLMMIAGNTVGIGFKEAKTFRKIKEEVKKMQVLGSVGEGLLLTADEMEMLLKVDEPFLDRKEESRLARKLYLRQTSAGRLIFKEQEDSVLSDKERRAGLYAGGMIAGISISLSEGIEKSTPVGSLSKMISSRFLSLMTRRVGYQYLLQKTLVVVANLWVFKDLEGEKRQTQAEEWVGLTAKLTSNIMTSYYTVSVLGRTLGPTIEKASEVAGSEEVEEMKETATLAAGVEDVKEMIATVTGAAIPADTDTPEPTETLTPEPEPTETLTPEPEPTETLTPEPEPTEELPLETSIGSEDWEPGSAPPDAEDIAAAKVVNHVSVEIGEETVELDGFDFAFDENNDPDVWVDKDGRVFFWEDGDGFIAYDSDGDGNADLWYAEADMDLLYEDDTTSSEGVAKVGKIAMLKGGELPAPYDLDLNDDGIKDIYEIDGEYYLDRNADGDVNDEMDVKLKKLVFALDDGVYKADLIEFEGEGGWWKYVGDDKYEGFFDAVDDDGNPIVKQLFLGPDGGEAGILQQEIHEDFPVLSPREVGRVAYLYQKNPGDYTNTQDAVQKITGVTMTPAPVPAVEEKPEEPAPAVKETPLATEGSATALVQKELLRTEIVDEAQAKWVAEYASRTSGANNVELEPGDTLNNNALNQYQQATLISQTNRGILIVKLQGSLVQWFGDLGLDSTEAKMAAEKLVDRLDLRSKTVFKNIKLSKILEMLNMGKPDIEDWLKKKTDYLN